MSERGSQANRRVTLRDVARMAGVSEISVSRVMRNTANISPDLRRRVTEAANALGYTPNRLAGGLKSNTSNLVAVIVPSMTNTIFPEVLDGIDSVLSESHFQPVLGITHYNKAREVTVLRDMLAWSPAGVMIIGAYPTEAAVKMLQNQTSPVVQMLDLDADPIHVAVGISHKKAAREVADFVVGRGYRRIGYIGGWGERPERSRARRIAFEAQLATHGLSLRAKVVREERSSVSVGESATGEMRAKAPDVDCIFYANDDLAAGGVLHCMRHGLQPPKDLALVGFNGSTIGSALPVELTTVAMPTFETGVQAARSLFPQVGAPETPRRLDLGYSLRVGNSA
jgi:LacI family gluconate utilization system Gnt-I transcriptional repressor